MAALWVVHRPQPVAGQQIKEGGQSRNAATHRRARGGLGEAGRRRGRDETAVQTQGGSCSTSTAARSSASPGSERRLPLRASLWQRCEWRDRRWQADTTTTHGPVGLGGL